MQARLLTRVITSCMTIRPNQKLRTFIHWRDQSELFLVGEIPILSKPAFDIAPVPLEPIGFGLDGVETLLERAVESL